MRRIQPGPLPDVTQQHWDSHSRENGFDGRKTGKTALVSQQE